METIKKHYPFWLGLFLIICMCGYSITREAPSVFLIISFLIGWFRMTDFNSYKHNL